MMRTTVFVLALLGSVPSLVGGAALAQTRLEVTYALRISGILVGGLSLSSVEAGRSYSVAGLITSKGAARVFRDFSYQGRAQGQISGTAFVPRAYEEVVDTGRRQSETEITYSGGVPQVLRYTSERVAGADSPPAATQGDAVDPLTASFALLRPGTAEEVCNRVLVLFDGRRRSHFALNPPQRQNGRIICTGEYRRIAGFRPDEVARHRAFPLTAAFTQTPNGLWQASEIALRTIYGPATITRN
ncbi:MAG: DUF3108 domain-containing protein [Pseudomonadota bacterium]